MPFWIVQTVSDSLDANLVLKIYTVNGIDIRCLVNDKKIKEGDALVMSEATKKELAKFPEDTLKRKPKAKSSQAKKVAKTK